MSAWTDEVPRADRILGAIALLALAALTFVRPVWLASDPWTRTVVEYWAAERMTDPWGRLLQYYDIKRSGRHGFVYSVGPDGQDDTRPAAIQIEATAEELPPYPGGWLRGDDRAVAWGHINSPTPGPEWYAVQRWALYLPGVVLGAAAVILFGRQWRAQASRHVGVEAARSFVLAAPAALGLAVLVTTFDWRAVDRARAARLVSFPVAAFATAEFVFGLTVLAWRTTRRGTAR